MDTWNKRRRNGLLELDWIIFILGEPIHNTSKRCNFQSSMKNSSINTKTPKQLEFLLFFFANKFLNSFEEDIKETNLIKFGTLPKLAYLAISDGDLKSHKNFSVESF